MKKLIGKDIIPLLISITLVIISIGISLFSDVVLNYKHYIGFGLIGISFLLYFKNKTLYVYFFVLTLLLGIINLIDIYYWNIKFGIGPIKFNPIVLTLLIIFLAFNKELLNKVFPENNLTEKEMVERNEEKEKLIKNYELKFQSKTESELRSITHEESGFVNEAKIAADQVLKNKYVL